MHARQAVEKKGRERDRRSLKSVLRGSVKVTVTVTMKGIPIPTLLLILYISYKSHTTQPEKYNDVALHCTCVLCIDYFLVWVIVLRT